MDPELRENENGVLDTEGNLFDTLGNNPEFEDDDDDEIEIGKSFEDFSEEDNDDDEDEDEDEDKGLWDKEDEENEDEDDDSEFNEKELEAFNKKLGTDFKSVDDLKKSFVAKETETEQQKEAAEYKTLSNRVELFDRYIGMDNESLIREQLLSEASNSKKDIEDPDVLEEIEEKIEGLKDLKTLDSMADTLRSNLKNQKEKTEGAIQKIDDKRTLSENQIAKKNTEDLQNAFSDIFSQKEFLGITVTKKDIQDAYESVRTNKFFDSVNGNQEMIAQFAMFVKYRDQLSKLSNKPTHSDKLKGEFNLLSGNDSKQRRSITQAKGSASSGSSKDNLSAFLK